MPYQVYTDPNLAAQLQAQGGRDVAHGISQGVASLVKGFTEGMEERKRLGQQAKAAVAMVKSFTDQQSQDLRLPDKETFAQLSASDQIATLAGAIQAHGFRQRDQEMQTQAVRTKLLQDQAANEAKEPAFYESMARFAPPGDLPYNLAPQDFERYALPEGQPRVDVKQFAQEAGRMGYHLPPKEMFELLSKRNGLDLPTAFEMARNPPPGFGSGVVTINPNSTPGLTFNPKPDLSTTATPIVTDDGKPTGKGRLPNGQIIDTTPPPDRMKALTDAQANALQFSERMDFNNKIIEHLEGQGFNPASVSGAAQEMLPNYLAGDASQQYTAASRNWISAVLRKESGAAISKSEETAARAQYFPKLGDGPAVIKQKAALRKLAMENMRRATGDIDKDLDAARIGDVRKAVGGAKVMVTKDGKKSWLPASQLEDAKRQGYEEVK